MKRFLRLAVAIGMALTVQGCAVYPHGYSIYSTPYYGYQPYGYTSYGYQPYGGYGGGHYWGGVYGRGFGGGHHGWRRH